ncbi:leucine-rich repeat and calponin homology domain-containing protein 1 isoform X4 [Tachysurus fulvidraco]|uniref:leucine-rich repeat and calponin homology domain-containing protein 1 isoform X4 n=1 Tax=Tachysurus fulvidraco TaxID=1234273 RepID=UPI001FEF4501|nr:leucine-rich repeat and calponin homology domain-containing protein 1 isoform X4 [Tachysurus fulvidraco]
MAQDWPSVYCTQSYMAVFDQQKALAIRSSLYFPQPLWSVENTTQWRVAGRWRSGSHALIRQGRFSEPIMEVSGAAAPRVLSASRGVERALEEAAGSGTLNLSSRKLKEFTSAAAHYDLSDTVHADLSKNRLTEVPPEVTRLVSLETLNLYHNCIRSIPDTIIGLQSLTSLNISRNQLSVLPVCVCGLPLRVLNASNNKLNALPESIGQLTSLMELDVSCNEVTALPRQIGRLKALRELNVRRNLLCVLPEDLAVLPLVKFDFSCNKVSTIPICYRKMTQLQSLHLENNPLQSPPAQICIKGKVHIFKYLTMESCRSDKMADALYLPVIDHLGLSRPTAGSTEDIDQHRKLDSDSGLGSDNGDKRLSATEPSDEDSLSLNVPMSNITEEEGICKDDSIEHISSLTADQSPSDSGQFGYRDSSYTTRFINYIKGRGVDFDEPLRIEEDSNWAAEQSSKVNLIRPLKEAVDLLQNPNRVNMSSSDLSGIKLYPVEMVTVDESLNGQESEDGQTTPKGETICEEKTDDGRAEQENSEAQSPVLSPPFGLKPRSAPPPVPYSPLSISRDTLSISRDTPTRPHDGCVPLSVFLRTPKSLESADPQFTMRRRMEQLREELELVEQLRENIESRLKVVLPEDLGSSLMDGVVLCHLANHVKPRSVASIHVPSPAVPKLSMAKCRRNVENFLDACRKIGVPESSLCSAYDILQCSLRPVRATVRALVSLEDKALKKKDGGTDGETDEREKVEMESLSPCQDQSSPWHVWDLIGSRLVHLFCLLLLFGAYTWSELT